MEKSKNDRLNELEIYRNYLKDGHQWTLLNDIIVIVDNVHTKYPLI